MVKEMSVMPAAVRHYLIDCYEEDKTLQETIDFAHKESPNVSIWVTKHSKEFESAWVSKILQELNS